MHARYEVPREVVVEYDPAIGMRVPIVKRMFTVRAYLVDLDGTTDGLDRLDRVLLHQRPRRIWWFLREVTEEELEQMEQYRQA